MTSPRLPRQLTDKYDSLLRERLEAATRMEVLDRELESLGYAMRVLDPEWSPPAKARKKQAASRLPHGSVSRDCLALLRQHGQLWTPELVNLLIQRKRLRFTTRQSELDFASAAAMALRRYECKGLLEVTEQDPQTQALRWRICEDLGGSSREPS
jgi:hypothetical protein